MRTIYKYGLEVTDYQTLLLPPDSKILSVQFQGEMLCLWAEIETDLTQEVKVDQRKIWIFGTGHQQPTHLDLAYITTVLDPRGPLVWHVYEQVV